MSRANRDKEIRYYQDRINQLEAENRRMKGSLHYIPTNKDFVTDSVLGNSYINSDLSTRN